MVLTLRREPTKTSGDVDWGNHTQARKRLRHEVDSSRPQPPPGVSSASPPPAAITVADDDEEEPAQAYAKTDGDEDATLRVLAELAQSAPPLNPAPSPGFVPTTPVNAVDESNEWVFTTVGVTPMLYNDSTKKFRCPHCNLEKPTGLGIATHIGKYCKKSSQPKSQEDPGALKSEDGDEDTI
jgi:hypothetical protein